MAQIIIQNIWALALLLAAWLLLLLISWRRRFRPFGPFLLRLAIIVLIALALAEPIFVPPATQSDELPRERLVLLVDQSASLGEAGQTALRAEAARLAQENPDSIIVFFADRPVVVPAANQAQVEPELPLNPIHSDLARALALGAELLQEQPGRLVLLSDGVPTAGDTLAAATALAEQGLPVDVLLPAEELLRQWAGSSNEVRMVGLEAPPAVRQGQTFELNVLVHSLAPTDATLKVSRTSDGTVLAEDVVTLEAGLNHFSFETEAEMLGPQTFRATLATPDDGQPANNSWSVLTQVYPASQILIVSDELFPAIRLAGQLEQAGFVPSRISAAELPVRLSELEAYAGMVLVNVPARNLKLEQMIAVQEFVRSLGRGLVVTGGRTSYSLGDYKDTPLAELLPVSLEPPPREERPPVAMLLVIDHSGSMVETRTSASKLAMAKEAAIRATDTLGPEDLIGVLMFDNRYEWVVPFQPVSDGAALLEIQQAIATIPGGGGTRILPALEVGLAELAAQVSASGARHAVLLTDGKSFDGNQGLEDYNLVVDAAQEANITLSTIAIGSGADQELLQYLAERGRGRYHFAAFPEELPELTIAESDILRTDALQEGEFQPTVFAPHPILRGLPMAPAAEDRMPDLSGYIALTPKPRAEIALQTGPGDPLLSVWGYGLGRVAAWAADNGQEWATNLTNWPAADRFWGQVVEYTLPSPELGLLQLTATIEADGVLLLTADGVTANGQPVDLAATEATLTTSAGRQIPVTLRQVAPGRYQQRLQLVDAGAYPVQATQDRGNEPAETAITGLIWPYPAEYGLPEPGTGAALLQQIAALTGGRTFLLGQSWLAATSVSASDQTALPTVELWPWLLLAALALWPLEIAWRRWARLRIQ